MPKADRHNEIEINYFTEGSLTYLFQDAKIEIPPKSFTVFWGLIPHQIVDYTNTTPYYVCTIPLTIFLEWKLPATFVDKVFKGRILIEDKGDHSFYDEYMLKNWTKDFSINKDNKLILLEIHARLLRMSDRILSLPEDGNSKIYSSEINKVEQIALFIAQNYQQPIKTIDISKTVGLHPDYANVVFKKTFGTTINDYIIQERISHAKRKLITSDDSITNILYDSGFNSISRFNAAFRKVNKCTPREFKKRFQ
ncbi:helix-turn-helix domain-containing protein [Flammeovirgaceae bacterium SG7u.111]|nr:helix-turn-helix domain-containing protein [Flammeovirgaceae bacterium SG7u.132]WPO33175.1 helix-turn-helix domain-containing protein [Flammeovirgaceae bacterium SG7u.111]